jgi:glucose/arabinose dehydrogenase
VRKLYGILVGSLIILSGVAIFEGAPQAQAKLAASGPFADSVFANGLKSPTAMDFSPDWRLFVAEKDGNLKIIQDGKLLDTPFVSIPVSTDGERGLLGVAFDPDFAKNGNVYVYYTANTNPIHNRVSRFTADPANPNVALAGSEHHILDLDPVTNTFHNGGAIHFGKDGKLYVAVGNDENSPNSQSLATDLGKILRINPDGSAPSDNPFYNTAGAKKEIWALGLRNPFTFAFSPAENSTLMYINDAGEDASEEIDSGAPGANYGWPTCEGLCLTLESALIDPIFAYNHNGTHSVIAGGAFYESSQFPLEYRGSYFFGDYVRGTISRLTPDKQKADFLTGIDSPVDIKIGADGSLYYLSFKAGEVHKVQYSPPKSANLAVNSIDNIGNQIYGYYAVLLQNSTTAATGLTPAGFTLKTGQNYDLAAGRFGSLVFDHWLDTNSTTMVRSVSITGDTKLTSVYRDVNQPPPPGKSQIFVNTTDSDGNEIGGYYTTLWQNGAMVQDAFSKMSFIVGNNQTYSVAVSDFGNFVFDHWSDGTTSRFHDVATGNGSVTKVEAIYRQT